MEDDDFAVVIKTTRNEKTITKAELSKKVNVRDMAQYINDGGYNQRLKTSNLRMMVKSFANFGFGDVICDALQPLLDRLDFIESRYVYEE